MKGKTKKHYFLGLTLTSFLLSFSATGCTQIKDLFPFPSESSESKTGSSSKENSSSSSIANSSSEEAISNESSENSSVDGSNSETIEKEYDEISFFFISLGKSSDALFNGDSIYIKAGDNDILIDAGPKNNAASRIEKVIDEYCEDDKLEYVIATHGHADHLPAFYGTSGIFSTYQVGTIIDFPKTNSTTATYKNYVSARDESVKKGATHYTALECWNETDGAKKTYTLGDGLSMSVLYQKYYETSTSNENNYSVCLLFSQGEKKMLFTGDLEDDGIDSLLKENDIGKVDLYKGGHHGSFNANPDSLLSVIKPETICTCCVAGSTEYTQNKSNTMPYQNTIDVWSRYTDDVYITNWATSTEKNTGGELNGTIEVEYGKNGEKTVRGSNNSLKLKDTEWIKNNRDVPEWWK